MSRARRWPVGGEPEPAPAERPVPTKEQILTVLDSARLPVSSRTEVLVACAQLYGLPDSERRMNVTERVKWARTVIDYPAAERLFDKMADDGLVVGREAWAWKESGVDAPTGQPTARYYASARRALAVDERRARVRDDVAWAEAGMRALDMLAKKHSDEYERYRQEAYDALRKGVRPIPADQDEEESA